MIPVFKKPPVLVNGVVSGVARMPDGSFHIVSVKDGKWALDSMTSLGDMMEGYILSPERIKSLGVPPFELVPRNKGERTGFGAFLGAKLGNILIIPFRVLFITKKKVVVLIAVLSLAGFVCGWMLLGKTTELHLNVESCEPSGIIGKARMSVQGGRFIADQLEVIKGEMDEIDYYLSPNRKAELQKIYADSGVDKALDEIKRDLQMIHQEYPSLAPSAAEEYANKLRAEAALIEAADVEAKIRKHFLYRRSKLEKCKQRLQENVNK